MRELKGFTLNPILWNSALVQIPKEMFIKEKGKKKPIKVNILTATKQIATKNKKPAINIIPSNNQFVEIDTEDAVIEEHRYGKSNIERELTKWGSVDLHVPKKMALYNGDGERFLKDSLTKTNKLAKYQNQNSIRFKTVDANRTDLYEDTGGNESKPKMTQKELIRHLVWFMYRDKYLYPSLKFIKQLKLDGIKVFTKEYDDEHKKAVTPRAKGILRRTIVFDLFDVLFPEEKDDFFE